ncbi:L domain-like protein [Gonapodya prolifera JEL478]|uniref:L domain-like protein n=1 Tax=Gonapodya prolifera (strain JEL478) TaxID=1344416 RepID=A0A139AAD3_GONPJ|nr:L domain-like protein [Gonapodya prolifera JEL478]|eukprot:KXS13700.1 L domain-like protein [Gonapodya prolifera JEL478]
MGTIPRVLLLALLSLIGAFLSPADASLADCRLIETFVTGARGTVPWTSGTECCGFVQGKRNVTCDATGRVISLSWGPTAAEAASGTNALSAAGTSLSTLAGLTELRVLSLVNNTLTGTAPSWITSLSKLSQLYLTNNQLTGMPDLSPLASTLTILDIGSNSFSGNLFSWVTGMTALQELWVGRNAFSGPLPTSLANLRGLRFLVLQYNQFTGSTSFISGFTNLQALVVRDNKFTGTFPDTSNMPYLTALQADNNGFTGPVPASLAKNTYLIQLSLAGNGFSGDVPNLSGLANLRYINLASNPSISGTLDNLLPAALTTCYLSGTGACATALSAVPVQCRIAQAGVSTCSGAGSSTGGTGSPSSGPASAPPPSSSGKPGAAGRRRAEMSTVAGKVVAAGVVGAWILAVI